MQQEVRVNLKSQRKVINKNQTECKRISIGINRLKMQTSQSWARALHGVQVSACPAWHQKSPNSENNFPGVLRKGGPESWKTWKNLQKESKISWSFGEGGAPRVSEYCFCLFFEGVLFCLLSLFLVALVLVHSDLVRQ